MLLLSLRKKAGKEPFDKGVLRTQSLALRERWHAKRDGEGF